MKDDVVNYTLQQRIFDRLPGTVQCPACGQNLKSITPKSLSLTRIETFYCGAQIETRMADGQITTIFHGCPTAIDASKGY